MDLDAFSALLKVAKEKTLWVDILQKRMELCPLETLHHMEQLHLLPFKSSQKK